MFVFLMLTAAQKAFADCPQMASPVISLTYESPYDPSDPTRSTLVPEAKLAMEAALAPVDETLRTIARLADAAFDDEDARRCLLDALNRWAKADALSDLQNQQVHLTIGARLAGFALIARRLERDTSEISLTTEWLTRRAMEQVAFWDNEAPKAARRGNLMAWAALAVWTTGDLAQSDPMQSWAEQRAGAILCNANDDGSLPTEMARGRFALHYQLHALSPLVTLRALGADLSCEAALKTAVDFALSDLENGAASKRHAGVKQSYFDGTERLDPHELAFLEAFLSFDTSPQAAQRIKDLRPLRNSKLGGNQTQIWGAETSSDVTNP